MNLQTTCPRGHPLHLVQATVLPLGVPIQRDGFVLADAKQLNTEDEIVACDTPGCYRGELIEAPEPRKWMVWASLPVPDAAPHWFPNTEPQTTPVGGERAACGTLMRHGAGAATWWTIPNRPCQRCMAYLYANAHQYRLDCHLHPHLPILPRSQLTRKARRQGHTHGHRDGLLTILACKGDLKPV